MPADTPISIVFNGTERTVLSRTVASLLEEFELAGKRVAVELNRQIVPRTDFSSVSLQTGDTVEIVQFVGGG